MLKFDASKRKKGKTKTSTGTERERRNDIETLDHCFVCVYGIPLLIGCANWSQESLTLAVLAHVSRKERETSPNVRKAKIFVKKIMHPFSEAFALVSRLADDWVFRVIFKDHWKITFFAISSCSHCKTCRSHTTNGGTKKFHFSATTWED